MTLGRLPQSHATVLSGNVEPAPSDRHFMRFDQPGRGHKIKVIRGVVAMEARKLHASYQFPLPDLKVALQTLESIVTESTEIIVVVVWKQGGASPQVGTMCSQEGGQRLESVGTLRRLATQGRFIRFVPQKIGSRLLALEKSHDPAVGARMSRRRRYIGAIGTRGHPHLKPEHGKAVFQRPFTRSALEGPVNRRLGRGTPAGGG